MDARCCSYESSLVLHLATVIQSSILLCTISPLWMIKSTFTSTYLQPWYHWQMHELTAFPESSLHSMERKPGERAVPIIGISKLDWKLAPVNVRLCILRCLLRHYAFSTSHLSLLQYGQHNGCTFPQVAPMATCGDMTPVDKPSTGYRGHRVFCAFAMNLEKLTRNGREATPH